MDRLSKAIDAGVPVTEAKRILQDSGALTKVQRQWLQRRIARADYGKAVRLYYYLGKALGHVEVEALLRHAAYAPDCAAVVAAMARVHRDDQTVKRALRRRRGRLLHGSAVRGKRLHRVAARAERKQHRANRRNREQRPRSQPNAIPFCHRHPPVSPMGMPHGAV